MIAEQDTDYLYKDEIIRNYINLIIHEALKMQPPGSYSQQKNAAARSLPYSLNCWNGSSR